MSVLGELAAPSADLPFRYAQPHLLLGIIILWNSAQKHLLLGLPQVLCGPSTPLASMTLHLPDSLLIIFPSYFCFPFRLFHGLFFFPPTSARNIEIPRFGLGLWLNQSTSWIIFNHMCHFLHFSVLTNLYVGFKLSHTSDHTPYGFLDMSPAGVLNHCKFKIFKTELFLIMWTLSSLYILYFR